VVPLDGRGEARRGGVVVPLPAGVSDRGVGGARWASRTAVTFQNKFAIWGGQAPGWQGASRAN